MQDRLESKKREKETNQVTLRSYWHYFVPLLVFLGYLAFHFWLMSVLKILEESLGMPPQSKCRSTTCRWICLPS